MRNRSAVALAIGLGLLAVLMMMSYVSGLDKVAAEAAEPKEVCVAAVDILANTVIDERLTQRIQVPTKYAQPLALTDCRAAVGRVTVVPVPRGAQFVGTALLGRDHIALEGIVSKGQRAVTIAVSDVTGVAGLLRPGNSVDVIVTIVFAHPVGQPAGRVASPDERTEVRTIMQNVLVLAVGQNYQGERPEPSRTDQPRPPGEPAQGSASGLPRDREVRNVTVQVSPAQVQELVLAQQVGHLTLALRTNLDPGRVDVPTLDPLGLFHVDLPIKTRETPFGEIHGF